MKTPGLLDAVAEVATLAGARALRWFPGAARRAAALDVDLKGDGSPVTQADREAEQVARQWIEKRFPGDGIVGEEHGETRAGAPRRWIVDPIDGTKSFVRGVPLWGTLVAVAEGDAVVAGAAAFPALDETVAAARGEGCWWNGARCAVSLVADLSAATSLTTDETFRSAPARREAWTRLAAHTALARSWGDCYGYLLVATGRAEIMVDPILADWDAAAVMPIVEEAGGVFTDWDGARTAWGRSAIATNAALAREAREALAGRA